ncbi:DUF2169 family type VI secretion system accessory protein [Variovorax paradoxus]|uniref:DUF2169 family type VI secretion system accessory protein n=1 Tax=Variovorax paradoxus TaxID=34073 RepID=UPI0029C790ED|nr:DUF2169 domain-containing protein [Variovorax paradoxus]
MWQIDNRTPFAVGQGWVRDRDGAEVWLVAVKASFDVMPDGALEIAREQSPLLRAAQYVGEPGKSSLRHESDMVLTKTTTDVLVVGHAFAPGGQPVTTLDVGFRVGSMQKVLRVLGPREWGALGPTKPEPFVSMPLVYERAWGGVDIHAPDPGAAWDWRNPVGCGFAVRASNLHGLPLPNIEWPDRLIRSWDDRPDPAGFGPICSHWQPRASYAGTYDDHWMATRQPLLPEDFDARFFQCAPVDQQAREFLVGGEQVMLLNLTPASQMQFRLPALQFDMQTRFSDGERREHEPPRLHTVLLEPDFPRVSMVWHSALECHAKVYQLQDTRVTLRKTTQDEEDDEPVDNLLDLV